MERSLVRQGHGALTLTLPAAWLQQRGLRAGDAVSVEQHGNELRIASRARTVASEATIDLRDVERSVAFHLAIAKYVEGADALTLLHRDARLGQDIAAEFLGMIVEEHNASRTVLRSIIAVPQESVEAVLRRAMHIFLQQVRTMEEVALARARPEDVKQAERLLDRHVLYCLRHFNKYERQQEAYRHFLAAAMLELAGDQVSRLSKHIGKDCALAATVRSGIEDYLLLLPGGDLVHISRVLRASRLRVREQSFADGLAFALFETLQNFLGYLTSRQPLQAAPRTIARRSRSRPQDSKTA